jgi:hypothetical protein
MSEGCDIIMSEFGDVVSSPSRLSMLKSVLGMLKGLP